MTDANEDTPPAPNAAAPVGELSDGGWQNGYLTAEWVGAEVRRRRLRLALVVTALPLELESIRTHLDNLGGVRGEGGAVFECGTVSDLSQEWLIVTAETRAGTHNAQQAVSRAHSAFRSVGKFELMIFVGIGGSRKRGAPIGSVVAADKIYYPYGGKYTDGILSSRPDTIPMDDELVNIAQKVSRDKRWPKRIIPVPHGPQPGDKDYPVAMPPPTEVAPIASIEAVLDDPKSELEALLKSGFGDTHVVEMEGYGAAKAAASERTPGMVIRGVSDMTAHKSEEEDEVNQPIAASHAAAFAFEMLSHWGMHNDAPPIASHSPLGPVLTDDGDGAVMDAKPTLSGEAKTAGHVRDAGEPRGDRDVFASTKVEISVVLNISADFGPEDQDRLVRLQSSLRRLAGSGRIEIVEARAGSLLLLVADPDDALMKVGERQLREALSEAENVALVGMSTMTSYEARAGRLADLDAASTDLMRWPAALPDGERMERPELETLISRIEASASSTTALIGQPGAGKSALLSTLGNRMREAGWPVLAIKADLLDPDIVNEAGLRDRLGLGENPSAMLRDMAALGPVLLVIDQLDALAGYLDIKTARLSILLNLVRRLGAVDNVHIVLSSRVFEFQHDVRLRAVGAESVSLELPPWSEVLALLEARGVAAAGWPLDAQEVMRSPQALSTYLQLSSRYSSEPFASYQLMLDRLWEERVLAGGDLGERDRLATDIAEAMAEHESLWLAAARFGDRAAAMQALVAAGVLATADASVGFSHQTIFEFTLARSFAREPGRLSSFATERQDSLFLRPKLWSGLTYLRGADPDLYHRELESIWRTPDLRAHLRVLLIDFLGSQSDPSDREAILMDGAIANEATALRAFKALAGSEGWFRRLADGRIADAMRTDGPQSNAQMDVLTRALAKTSDAVLRLIRDNWLPDVVNDLRSWSVLQWLPQWTDEALSLALTIIGRTDMASSMIDHRAGSIAVEQPEVALRLVCARLERELVEAVAQSEARAAALPAIQGETAEEQVAERLAERGRDPIRNLLERNHDWDSLAGIAETWPRESLDVLSPWFTRALGHLDRTNGRQHRIGYPLGLEADFRFDGENDLDLPEGSLLGALRIAVERLADADPPAFRAWILANQATALTPVQRLIAHGIAHRPAEYATDGLEFALGDERRYFLGSIHDLHGTIKRMVRAVSPFWTRDQVRRFEERVQSFAPPPPSDETDPKGRMSWRHSMRRTQLDLLRALPARQRSPEAARQVHEDERRYGRDRAGASFSGVRMIGSVIEADGMAKASDADIINAFAELPDATGWDNPRNWMSGGNVQLARAFATFSKDHIDRALGILSRLGPTNGTRAAGYAIDALSEAAPPETVFELVRDVTGRGFDAEEFRHSVARALDRMARRSVEVPEDLIDLLEWWVANPLVTKGDDEDAEEAEDEHEVTGEDSESDEAGPVEQSSLWGHGGFGAFPGGDVPVADAVTHIRLLRGQTDQALAFLSRYLDQQKGTRAWEILASYLPHLAQADPARRVAFLDQLLTEVGGVVGSKRFAKFLASSQRADHDLVERHIDDWRKSPSTSARQAYGEIVALDALLRPDHVASAERLKRLMGEPSERSARAGAALSAAHVLAEEPTRRDAAASLLAHSLERDELGGWSAALELFRLSDELPADEATRKVLRALADGLPRAPKVDATFIVDRLATLLPHEAALVGEIALGLVAKWDADLGDIRTATAMAASALVDLSLTLHRLGPETREVGLQLFEHLIRIDAYEAHQTLDEIDNRFRPSAPVARPRLRRRSEVAPRRPRRRG